MMLIYVGHLLQVFQSTLPRGSDLILFGFDFKSDHFNPRSLAGATLQRIQQSYYHHYFNPRSLAGAT